MMFTAHTHTKVILLFVIFFSFQIKSLEEHSREASPLPIKDHILCKQTILKKQALHFQNIILFAAHKSLVVDKVQKILG